jgi:hypothetical protein
MSSNPLQTPTAALQFLVDFAQQPLDELSPRQLIALERDVQRFISRDARGHWRADGELGRVGLGVLQTRLLQLLAGLAKSRTPRFAMAGDLLLTFLAVHDGHRVHVEVLGTDVHKLLYQTVRLLETVGLEKLHACPAPKAGTRGTEPCGRVFLKVTKKRYCSSRCQMRHYQRRDRAGEFD